MKPKYKLVDAKNTKKSYGVYSTFDLARKAYHLRVHRDKSLKGRLYVQELVNSHD